MEPFDRFLDFSLGLPDDRLRVTVEKNGLRVRGEASQQAGGGLLIAGVPKQNDPAEVQAHVDAWDADVSSGNQPDFRLDFGPFRPVFAKLGWMRAAYLASFALLGYRYIVLPSFETLRRQFTQPTRDFDRSTTVLISLKPTDRTRYLIMVVEEPEPLRSVLVQMGRYRVLLPPIGDESSDFFTRVRDALPDGSTTLQAQGKMAAWPTGSSFLLD